MFRVSRPAKQVGTAVTLLVRIREWSGSLIVKDRTA